jgi:hypothetical protein
MQTLTKRQFIWKLINNEKHTCRAAAEAYIINAKEAGEVLGVSQLCIDGFPNAGKIGQRSPEWDKIKCFINQAREQYEVIYPNEVHVANQLAKYNRYNLGRG